MPAEDRPRRAYAHSKDGVPVGDWHTLEEHLRGTAVRSAKFARRHPSPPARGRGLKLDVGIAHDPLERVAPRAGAWIEVHEDRTRERRVAPFA